MLVCDEGNIEMVDILLQYSADPNLQQPVSKIEVLQYLFCEAFAWHLDQAISHVANCMHAAAIHLLRVSCIIIIRNFTIVVFTISSFISFPKSGKLLMISVLTDYMQTFITPLSNL